MDFHKINERIWHFYKANKRDFPWRRTTDPYYILVSEIMLQQTQTGRVIDYYQRFITEFPTVKDLATAPLSKVLKLWQGLGYNRRAKFLKAAAEKIVQDFNAVIPNNLDDLISLPGIGKNTAGAILAYAFNQKVIFIETNIRKTIIHFCFPKSEQVSDMEIEKKIEQLIVGQTPREWYWAVVDYGSMLGKKKTITNNRSSHYRKQSKFEGSNRQIRSAVLKIVLANRRCSLLKIVEQLPYPIEKIKSAIFELENEQFIRQVGTNLEVVH